MNKVVRNALLFLLGLVLVLVLGQLAGGPDDLELQRQEYCHMVMLNRADPTVGWPDYRQSFNEWCTDNDQHD